MFRKKRFTKWKPLGNFSFSGKDYVTLFRKNLKDGMLEFKTIRVNVKNGVNECVNSILPHDLIDTKKAWDEMCSE